MNSLQQQQPPSVQQQQQQSQNPQMNNPAGYSTHPHQMQQGQGQPQQQMAHGGYNAMHPNPNMMQQQQQPYGQQPAYNQHSQYQYYQNTNQQMVSMNQKTSNTSQQPNMNANQSPNNMNGPVPNPINATSYMHSPMAPPPPPQPPPSGGAANANTSPGVGPQQQQQQQPGTGADSANQNSTTIQNVQINVQNNFNIKQNNLNQYGTVGAPGSQPQTPANGSNGTSVVAQPGPATGQVAGTANSWNMQPNSTYPNMGNMTPQQQQQYKQQQMQMQQQQQMYKMNQYNASGVPGQPGSGPVAQQPMNPNAYNPQSQQGGYSAYPNQHQYTNGAPGQLSTSPANPQVNKLNPMPPHMNSGQYAGYNQQPNPSQVAPNPSIQQRQQSPQTPYAASPNKMVYPNGQGMSVNVTQSPGPGAKPPQSSPGRMASNTGQYYQQGPQPGQQQQGAYPQYQMSQQYGQPGAYPGQGQQQQGYSNYGGNNMPYPQAGPQTGQSPINANRMGPYAYQMNSTDPNAVMSPSAGNPTGQPMSTPPATEVTTPTKGGRGKGKKAAAAAAAAAASPGDETEGKTKAKRASKKKSIDGIPDPAGSLSPLPQQQQPTMQPQQGPQQQQQHQSLYQQHQSQMRQPVASGSPQMNTYMMQQPQQQGQPAVPGQVPSNYAMNGQQQQIQSSVSPSTGYPGVQQQQQANSWNKPVPAGPNNTQAGPMNQQTNQNVVQKPPYTNQAPAGPQLNQFSTQPVQSQQQQQPVNGQMSASSPYSQPGQYQTSSLNGQSTYNMSSQYSLQPQPNQQPSQQGPIATGQSTTQLQAQTPNSTTQVYQQQPSSIPSPQLNPSTVMNSSLYQQQPQPQPGIGQIPQQQQQQIKPQTIPYMSTNPNQPAAMGQATAVPPTMAQPVGMVGGSVGMNPNTTGATPQTGTAVNPGQPQQMGMYQAQPQNMNNQMLPGQAHINQTGVTNSVATMPPSMTMAPNQTAPTATPVSVNGQPQMPMYGTNPSANPGNQTVSFLDQQQQLIQSNLNPDAQSDAAKASPAKKLTKKQLKKLNSGENLDMSTDGTTPTKKTPKPRKPKKEKKIGELNNSLSSSGSHPDLAAVANGANGEESMTQGENGSNPATTTQQSNIDSTIDDFMKQYKAEKKTKKTKKSKAINPEDAGAEESALASDSDDSLFGSDGSPQKPTKVGTKSRPKKQKKKDDEPYDELVMAAEQKKKTPARKKATIAQLDENGQPLAEPAAAIPKAEELFKPDIVCHLKAPELPMIVQRKNTGQRKNNINQLAKLMKGKKRKKKKGSDDDDDDDEDDSDEGYEVPVSKKGAKAKTAEPGAADEGTLDTENDELTAKALQASENKRRSTRGGKRTKYVDEAFSTADLIIPPTEAELAAEAAAAQAEAEAANANIVLTNQESLVIDKILGNRMFKRKTMRKKEKVKKVHIHKDVRLLVDELVGKVAEEMNGTLSEITPMETTINEEKTENDADTSAVANTSKAELNASKTDETMNEESEYELSEWEEDGGEIEVEEFYVKYKNFSYLHCEWRTRDELFASDKRIDQKIKRYFTKKSQEVRYEWDLDAQVQDEDLFNPDYVEVDRILDVFDMDDPSKPGQKLRYYLVKWKTLPYEEASWELQSDIKNQTKVDRFYKFNTIADIHRRYVAKPKPDKWAPMKKSRQYKGGNTIREYQLEGINWLTFCWLNGRNCILADEMGLGKTVQSLTFCQEMSYYGVHGPYLILVPLSTIGNWIREFEKWTDFNAIVYHGSSQSRQMLQDYEFYFVEGGEKPDESNSIATNEKFDIKKAVVKFNVFITTYEVLLSDVSLFAQFKWRSCIIDEAHRLKNKNCKLMEGLKYMDIEHKVLLTGTPLQNNVEELFSLLHFLEPDQFDSSVEFMKEFGNLQSETEVAKLQAILKPMMLRRLKEDVETSLAPKEETIVEVELTNTQKKYYRAILEKNFQFLSRGASSSNVPNLMNTMMELRKCCNHPYLISGSEDQIIAEFKEKGSNKDLESNELSAQAMIQASGKLVLVDKLLPKLKRDGHKVLIFSQMIRVLDIIEDYLVLKRFSYERIDGRIRGEMRQEAIDRYSKKDSDKFVFLLCTRAGGLGINLTAADTVIIYDSDWNPQNDLQAQARCHRIGQKKNVTIYRLITTNTYEREMFDKASLKLGLDKAVLGSMRNEDKFNQRQNQVLPNVQLSKKEIEDLLKKGAYGSIMEDDTAADKFCEDDIDTLLSKRATVVTIEGGDKGSTFSKASFQAADTSDINIDDPEFWLKWAKKADINVEEKLNPADERIIYEPRQRRQTRRFEIARPEEFDSDLGSDSNSDGDENKDPNNKDKDKKGKKGRRGRKDGDTDFTEVPADIEEPTKWSRHECYAVEKSLLTFGWGRWTKILKSCEFSAKKKGGVQTEQDVENLARCIIAFAMKLFSGDEQMKQFMLELVDMSKSEFPELRTATLTGPAVHKKATRASARKAESEGVLEADGNSKDSKSEDSAMVTSEATDVKKEEGSEAKDGDVKKENNEEVKKEESSDVKSETTASKEEDSGNDSKVKTESKAEATTESTETPFKITLAELETLEWTKGCEDLLSDETYKKHLTRQANRILLKLKTLHYIQHELIGAENAARLEKMDADEAEINLEQLDLQIPDLATDLPAEWWEKSCDTSMVVGVFLHGFEKYSKMRVDPRLCFLQLCGLPDAKELLAEQQHDENNEENAEKEGNEGDAEKSAEKDKAADGAAGGENAEKQLKAFPSSSEFNNRLRKLIAAHQKLKKQMELINKKNAERQEKRLSKLASTQERAVMRQMEKQNKWSRREEQNFYRTVATFGADQTGPGQYAWDRFKEIAQLDKKLDETLNDYFTAFHHMCKRVCGKLDENDKDSKLPPHLADMQVEVISEERATRCLQRIDMLNKVRQDVLKNKEFEAWMANCLPSPDLPDWWVNCKHDIELVKAASRYGITRTEYYYVLDGDYSFKEALNKYMSHIYELMRAENEEFKDPARCVDPIQYYFQNQAKIQHTLKKKTGTLPAAGTNKTKKDRKEKKANKKAKIEPAESISEPDDDVISKLLKELVTKTVIEIDGVTDEDASATSNKAENNDVDMAMDEDSRESTSDSIPAEEDKPTPSEQTASEEACTRTFEENSTFFGNSGAVPMIMWPKDRVLLNRLEMIIQMFEANGEWPHKSVFNAMNPAMNPAMMASLVANNPAHAHLLLAEQRKLMISPSMMETNGNHDMEIDGPYDQENSNSESDFLSAMQQHQANINGSASGKSGKPKRGRPPKFEPNLTATPEQAGNKRHSMFGNSNVNSRDGYSSNDDDNEPGEIRPNKSKLPAGAKSNNEPTVSKRGRKSTNFSNPPRSPPSAKQPEISSQDAATAAALAAMFMAPGQDPEERITVVNVENGQRLTGSKAPRRVDLPLWLISHPNYLPDESEIINLAMKQGQMNNPEFHQQQQRSSSSQKPTSRHAENDEDSNSPKSSRNPKQMDKRPLTNSNKRPMSPATSQPNNTLLATQVILFNKKSGKKLPPQNLPTWKSLCGFLDRNQQVFVDPKSNDLIRQKFGSNANVPSIIKSRQINVGSGNGIGRSSNGNGSDQNQQQQAKTTNMASRNSESPPPRTSQNARAENTQQSGGSRKPDRKSFAPNKSQDAESMQQQQQAELLAQQQLMLSMLGGGAGANSFAGLGNLSPNSKAQLQGLSDLMAASSGGQGNQQDQMQQLMALMAAGGASNPAMNGLGNFNPFMMPPFGNQAQPATTSTAKAAQDATAGMPPELVEMMKLMNGGKLPPNMDMKAFEELALTLGSNAQLQQQPQSPSTKSTSSSSSNHEARLNRENNKARNNTPKPQRPKESMSQNDQNRDSPSLSKRATESDRHSSSRKSKQPTSLHQQQRDQQPTKAKDSTDNQRPSSASSSASNNSRNVVESKQSKNKEPSGTKNGSNSMASNNSEQAALAALLAQSGLDPNAMGAMAMMEQEKMLQDMMSLSQMAGAGGLPPGLDPAMLSALASNPFLMGAIGGGGASNSFTPPAMPSPSQTKSKPSGNNKHKQVSRRSPSPKERERERSVSPASSVASNVSQYQQQQQQQQTDFNMLMQMMAGGAGGMMPPGLPMGLGALGGAGMPNDLSQLPPELLLALAGGGGVGGGMPGFDPSMLSALSQLGNLSNNAQGDYDYQSPNLNRSKSQHQNSRVGSNKGTPGSSSRDANRHQSQSGRGMDLSRSSDRRSGRK